MAAVAWGIEPQEGWLLTPGRAINGTLMVEGNGFQFVSGPPERLPAISLQVSLASKMAAMRARDGAIAVHTDESTSQAIALDHLLFVGKQLVWLKPSWAVTWTDHRTAGVVIVEAPLYSLRTTDLSDRRFDGWREALAEGPLAALGPFHDYLSEQDHEAAKWTGELLGLV